MKNVLFTPKAYMLAGLFIIAGTAIAWQTKTKKQPHDTTVTANANGDTSHPRKHDIDENDIRLGGLDENLKQLDVQLKNIDINLSGLDTTINNAVKTALNSIDFAEISKQTKLALDNIDWKGIQNNINVSMDEATKQIKNIDWNKIHADIKDATDQLKNQDIKIDLSNMHISDIVNNALNNAKEGIESARIEIDRLKGFASDLEKDGLIDKKKGYRIEWKDGGDLYINGTKQSKEVSDKYHKYYKEGGYTISNDGDETESL